MRTSGRFLGVVRGVLLLVLATWAVGCNGAPGGAAGAGFALEPGDLVFQDLDGGPLCDAIEKVTTGYRGANLSHVGIAAKDAEGRPVVLEAVSAGVKQTPLDAFLVRSHDAAGRPKVLVGRLAPEHRHLIPAALAAAEALKGKPYDKAFDIANDSYYCSELVYVCFLKANGGEPLFELQPMTFRDPGTGKTFPAWEDYFTKLGIPIPEGKPGINPGGISRSPALRIVHAYGTPSGWRQDGQSPEAGK